MSTRPRESRTFERSNAYSGRGMGSGRGPGRGRGPGGRGRGGEAGYRSRDDHKPFGEREPNDNRVNGIHSANRGGRNNQGSYGGRDNRGARPSGGFRENATGGPRIFRIPEHMDIVPVNHRIEQNMILSDLKRMVDIEALKDNVAPFERQHMAQLQGNKHLVTFNTGRSNFWLFLTFRNNRQCAFLIDRNLSRMWLLKSSFAADLYKGSLFEACVFQVDSEIPESKSISIEEYLGHRSGSLSPNHLCVAIHDTRLFQKKSLVKSSLMQRYEATVKAFRDSDYQYERFDFVEYTFKPYFAYDYIESAWYDYRPTASYERYIKGLMFRPVAPSGAPDLYFNVDGFASRPDKHVEITKRDRNINMLLRKTTDLDNYKLFARDQDGQLKYIDIALINDLQTSKMLQEHLDDTDEAVFECTYDNYFNKWKPVRISEQHEPDVIREFREQLKGGA